MQIDEQKIWNYVLLERLNVSEPGQFYVFQQKEEHDVPIRTLIQKNTGGFAPLPGSYFYQLTKRTFVAGYKRLVLKSHETGQFVYGANVREILKIEGDRYLEPPTPDEYGFVVFVQSYSTNRKVRPGEFVIGPMESLTVPT